METFVTLLIPAVLAIVLIRLLLMPLKLGFKIAIHCACGFVCLTLVLILGALATHEAHGTYFVLEHKTILTWLSWLVFAVLLAGRRFLGWRKKKALALFWAGIAFLAEAYLVYRFVLDALIA